MNAGSTQGSLHEQEISRTICRKTILGSIQNADRQDEYWGGIRGAARVLVPGTDADFEEFFQLDGRCLVALRDSGSQTTEHHLYLGEDLVKFHIRLSGNSTISLQDHSKATPIWGPSFGVMVQPFEQAKTEDLHTSGHQRWLTILLTRDSFVEMFESTLARLPAPLAALSTGGASQPYIAAARLNGSLSLAAAALFASKLHGSIRRLHFESKTLELLSLIAEHLILPAGNSQKSINLTARDLENIRSIYQILKDNPATAPSIVSLSKNFGINRDKIIKGFKQIHGQTITEASLALRMHRARDLLHEGESVTRVAHLTGYTYIGNFSAAYRRFFGASPTDRAK